MTTPEAAPAELTVAMLGSVGTVALSRYLMRGDVIE